MKYIFLAAAFMLATIASANAEWKKIYCLAYLRGIGDGLIVGSGICMQEQTSTDLLDVTVPFLRRLSPKDLAKDATLLLPAYWDKLWPCKEERQS